MQTIWSALFLYLYNQFTADSADRRVLSMLRPASAAFPDVNDLLRPWMLSSRFDLPVDPWGAADSRGQILAVAVFSILIAGMFLSSLVRRIQEDEIDPASGFALAPMAGILTLILISLPIFLWAAWQGKALNFRAVFSTAALALGAGAVILNLRELKPMRGPSYPLMALICLLCGLGFLRLVFIGSLVLPAYSDSVEHYLIVADLLHPDNAPRAFYKLADLSSHYYHFGFHALAGWVSTLSAASIEETLLVLGQVLQAVIPVSLFFLVRGITKSNIAGLVSVLLAGLAWRMPAYASNWGKYPALTSLAVLPFALGMLNLAETALDRRKKFVWIVFALVGGVLTALSHTRSFLLLTMAIASWWAGGRLLRIDSRWKGPVAAVFGLLTLWVSDRIFMDSNLTFMLAPYLREGLFPTLLAVVLVPHGLKNYPRQMASALLFLLFLLAAVLVPLPAALANYGYPSLLDRPFAQMVLFLPLSIMGGVGFAGVAVELDGITAGAIRSGLLSRLWLFAGLLLPLAVTVHAFHLYGFSPSPCCRLATADDLSAYAWIREELPADAVILIASNRTPRRSLGVDGGIWITPLTGFRTEKWPYNAPMDSPAELERICARGATHIYAGGTSTRFSVERMEGKPGWYENLFTRPGAYVYQITGCSGRAD